MFPEPPTYAESLTGAVDIRDEDDDQPGTMGDLTFTPMYTYVYDYRYRPPPAYSEVTVDNGIGSETFPYYCWPYIGKLDCIADTFTV